MSHHHKDHKNKPLHEQPGVAGEPRAQEPAAAPEAGAVPTAEGQPPAPPPDEAAALRAERDDLLNRLKWASADYQNYQKRVQKEIHHAKEFANETLIKALLAVIDDMDRAIAAADKTHPAADPLLAGIKLTRDKMLRTMKDFGVTAFEAQGRPFDPADHSAVMQQESAEHPPGTVLQQLQTGYQLKGRTIRPATVIVSKEPPAAEPPRAEGADEAEDQETD